MESLDEPIEYGIIELNLLLWSGREISSNASGIGYKNIQVLKCK